MPTLLSETLREVITAHSIVVAQLAKQTEINRTTLQHIISGRRVPSKEQMDRLLLAIPIPEQQKTVLRQAYEFTTHGPDKFEQREKVKTIIEKIAFASMGELSVTTPPQISGDPGGALGEAPGGVPSGASGEAPDGASSGIPGTRKAENLYGIPAIHDALVNIIAEEEDSVSFFMPPNFPFFYDTLLAKYTTSQTLALTCFFPMSNEADNIIPDLEYCEAFIPFFASPKYSFQAYYMRGQNALSDASIVPFPYFVLTSRFVLLLSADMAHALLTKEDAFVRMYHKKCQGFLNISSPLYTAPPLEELIMFLPQTPSKDVFAALENQPCFQYYLTEQIIKKYAIATTAEHIALVQKYTKYINEMKKEPDLFSAFGQEGLDYFVETGYISVWPPSLGKPLGVSDRIKLLQRMLNDIKSDVFNCRLVDASKFTIPSRTVTIAIRRKTLFVQCLDYAGGNVKNICLTEKNIVDAFTDFLSNLPKTGLLHSKEETVSAFEAALEKLRAG